MQSPKATGSAERYGRQVHASREDKVLDIVVKVVNLISGLMTIFGLR